MGHFLPCCLQEIDNIFLWERDIYILKKHIPTHIHICQSPIKTLKAIIIHACMRNRSDFLAETAIAIIIYSLSTHSIWLLTCMHIHTYLRTKQIQNKTLIASFYTSRWPFSRVLLVPEMVSAEICCTFSALEIWPPGRGQSPHNRVWFCR